MARLVFEFLGVVFCPLASRGGVDCRVIVLTRPAQSLRDTDRCADLVKYADLLLLKNLDLFPSGHLLAIDQSIDLLFTATDSRLRGSCMPPILVLSG